MAKADKPKATTGAVKGKADKAAKPKPVKGKPAVEEAKAVGGVAKGKVEKAAAKVTGNKKLAAKGQADESGAKGYGKAVKAKKKLSK